MKRAVEFESSKVPVNIIEVFMSGVITFCRFFIKMYRVANAFVEQHSKDLKIRVLAVETQIPSQMHFPEFRLLVVRSIFHAQPVSHNPCSKFWRLFMMLSLIVGLQLSSSISNTQI